MICKHCGKELVNGANFCGSCGKSVNENYTIIKNKKTTKKSKKFLIFLIIFFCVLTSVVLIFSIVKAEETEHNEIISTIEKNDYENAQKKIEDFLSTYPNSKYSKEIKEQKAKVDNEVSKLKEAEKIKTKAEKAGISTRAYEKMLEACKELGIKEEDISALSSKEDWAHGKRCSFNYNDYTFLVYFNQDETVNSINCGTIKFYENGKKTDDLSNRLISSDEMIQLKSITEDTIEKMLKSPSTAKFPGTFLSPYDNWSFSKSGNNYTVSSYVDSQNGFGATLRSQFTITYKKDNNSLQIISLIFNGKKIV